MYESDLEDQKGSFSSFEEKSGHTFWLEQYDYGVSWLLGAESSTERK